MSDTALPDQMLDRLEDLGGAAQPLLRVEGLTKHFPTVESVMNKLLGGLGSGGADITSAPAAII